MSKLIILGGPNGVGKSTIAESFGRRNPDFLIIDGDRILKNLIENGESAMLAQGIIKEQFTSALEVGQNVLFESNLNTPISYGYRDYAAKKGYETLLNYVAVDDVRLLNDRITERVKLFDLHYVDPGVVKAKFQAALNILPMEVPKFDRVNLFDNSALTEKPQAKFENGNIKWLADGVQPKWSQRIIDQVHQYQKNQEMIRRKTQGRGSGLDIGDS